MPRHQAGLTLIELMIGIAVLAIVLTLAVPAFNTIIQTNRVAAQANNLSTGFAYARAEAIKRTNTVSICARNPANNSCGNDWAEGWVVFDNPTRANNPLANSQLRIGESLPPGMSVTVITNNAPSPNIVHYERLGDIFLNGPAPGFQFTLRLTPANCPEGRENQREIDISRMGRTQVRAEECD